MNDLVTRLRETYTAREITDNMIYEAADEIEKLRNEVGRLLIEIVKVKGVNETLSAAVTAQQIHHHQAHGTCWFQVEIDLPRAYKPVTVMTDRGHEDE